MFNGGKFFRAATAPLAWLCLVVPAVLVAEEPAAAVRAAPVSLSLQLSSMKPYDPLAPEGKLVCLAKNLTDAPLTFAAEYGGAFVLRSDGLTLQRIESRNHGGERPQVTIAPGEEAVIFELPLAEILGTDRGIAGTSPIWRWSWLRRSSPPRSPIHKRHDRGFVDAGIFTLELSGRNYTVHSPPLRLEVKTK